MGSSPFIRTKKNHRPRSVVFSFCPFLIRIIIVSHSYRGSFTARSMVSSIIVIFIFTLPIIKRAVSAVFDEYGSIFKKSLIPKIRTALIAAYGQEKGEKFYAQSGQKFLALSTDVDSQGNRAIDLHITRNILPLVCCYLVLQQGGIAKEDACALVVGQMHQKIRKKAAILKTVAHFPFLYPFFRALCHRVMKNSYPDIGWDVVWLKDDNETVCFDCRACVYLATTTKFGYPELCQYFCQNDTIVYSALSPAVQFVRTQTLATGGDRCDFCFLNGKTLKNRAL